MEFSDELIEKLSEEGYHFNKNNVGDRLTYVSNYMHIVAKVFLGKSYQSCVPHFNIMHDEVPPGWKEGENNLIISKVFKESDDLETVLRSVAKAVDALDQGIEDAFVETKEYVNIE
jgi:hypothetical protein